jgi:chemotaxis protein CheD
MSLITLEKHYLYPSTLFVDRNPHQVDTVLGSCVSVILYDKMEKLGGINHYMLPLWNGNGLATPKYGNIAIEKLITKMEQFGAKRTKLVAKVFGGSLLVSEHLRVGEQNVLIARESLLNAGIPIVAENVGGSIGRKIVFNSYTGEVFMRFLSKGDGT